MKKCLRHHWYANFPWECADCGYRREVLGIIKEFVGFPPDKEIIEKFCKECNCFCGCHPCKHTNISLKNV